VADEIEVIIDQTGEERRLGSHMNPEGFVCAFPTFESTFEMWDDEQIKRVITDSNRVPRRVTFGSSWIQNQKSHGCHDAQTEVLTERGWKRWDEYGWSDSLATMNQVTGHLEYQQPTDKHIYDYSGDLLYADHNSLDFAITPNHRMYRRKWSEPLRTLVPEYAFCEAQDLGWYSGLPAATTGVSGVRLERVSIPGSIELLGNDFVAMVALITSDGWAGGVDGSVRNQVSFCCFNESRQAMVRELANRIGFGELPGRPGVWIRTDAAMAKWCRSNLYGHPDLRAVNKSIPQIIKTLCEDQMHLFLKFFGDKTHSEKAHSRVFYSSSKKQIDDIQELLLMIGKRSRVRPRDPKTSTMNDGRVVAGKHTAWECAEWKSGNLSLQPKKQIERQHYNGTVYCATVPNGTLVTRKNGQMLISGNSCNGYATAGALSRARHLRGIQDGLILSGAFPYSRMNGGRDNGSALSDGLKVIEQYGSCPESLVPWSMIYKNQQPANAEAEAAKHKGLVCYAAGTIQGLRTGLAKGFVAIVAVHAGGNFQRLDSRGIAGADSGGGNHAVHVDDLCIVSGKEVFDMANSWGTGYGTEGRAYLTKDSLSQPWNNHTAYLIGSTEEAG
jgi:hypothetical protein